MTGYGKSEAILEGGKLTVELRSVNGKSAEINIKSSLLPKDKEMGIRKQLSEALQRGTIDMFLTWEPNAADCAKTVNMSIAKSYIRQAVQLAGEEGSPDLMKDAASAAAIMNAVLRMPDVVDSRKQDVITEDNWDLVQKAIDEAVASIDTFRAQEGEALYKDVTSRVKNILDIYGEVESYESERVESIRTRILKNIEDLQLKPDKERFEQEMIFYLEKLDINEEKVRLRQHCKYFMDTIDGEPCPGKKLGFIIQEMGREINTTGSKANHASIQKCVVRMKDELEKIREQSMNIL